MKPINTLISALIIVAAVGAIITIAMNPPAIGMVHEVIRLEDEIKEFEKHIEMLNSVADIDRGEIPQWFRDEFNATFLGSYKVTVEDDKLNLVIITSNKRFSNLVDAVGRDDGYIGFDVYIDILEWKNICPDDIDDN